MPSTAFDAEENPAPPRLAAQLVEFRTSYIALNAAYALTRESLITQDIAALRRAHLPAEQQHRLREDSCHDNRLRKKDVVLVARTFQRESPGVLLPTTA